MLRCVVAVASAIVCAGKDQRVHRAGHTDVAEAALLLQFLGIHQGARMREEAFFESREKYEGKFKALGCMKGHQRYAGTGIELVGIRCERCVIEKLRECFTTNLGVVCSVGQFLQVFNPAQGFR